MRILLLRFIAKVVSQEKTTWTSIFTKKRLLDSRNKKKDLPCWRQKYIPFRNDVIFLHLLSVIRVSFWKIMIHNLQIFLVSLGLKKVLNSSPTFGGVPVTEKKIKTGQNLTLLLSYCLGKIAKALLSFSIRGTNDGFF